MSTKIYTGFISKYNLFDLYKALGYFSKEIAAIATKRHLDIVTNTAFHMLDTNSLIDAGKITKEKFVIKEGYSIVSQARHNIEERIRKITTTRGRDPIVDFEFIVHLYPFEGKLYGMYSTEQPEFRKLFEKQLFFQDYSYQDQTDYLPNRVSRKQYEIRGKVWDKILPVGYKSNELNGLDCKCLDIDYVHLYGHEYASITSVVNNMPSPKDRLKHFVKDFFIKEIMNKFPKDSALSTYLKANDEYLDWIKTVEGKKAYNIKLQELKANIITKKDQIIQSLS